MYKKIVCILVMMLLIVSMTISINAEQKAVPHPEKSLTQDVNPPIWEVGDTWTYDT